MALINAAARQRAKAKIKREKIKRILAKIGAELGQRPSEDVSQAFARVTKAKATARAAWTAVDAAEERARVERRLGVLARLRDGSLAVVRRVDRLPPGAERVEAEVARVAIAKGAPLRVVGHHGTASPSLHPDAFRRLAGALLNEVAA